MDYRAFGEAFVFQAVTPERVVEAVSRIAGDHVELGPIRAGPGGRASVHARGTIGEPAADEEESDPLTYSVHLPVEVDLEVKVGAVHRFRASGRIAMRLTVRTAPPLHIVIDVAPVQPDHVQFDIEAQGVPAKLLGRAGDVDGELRRHTASYVNERISAPETGRLTRIDLVPLIERVWTNL
jgi:hypothetical protein